MAIEQRAEAWQKENPDVTDVTEAYYIGFHNAQTEHKHQTESLEERVKELEEVLKDCEYCLNIASRMARTGHFKTKYSGALSLITNALNSKQQ